MVRRDDLITWALALLLASLAAVVGVAAGARLGAALSISAIALVATVAGRLALEERS